MGKHEAAEAEARVAGSSTRCARVEAHAARDEIDVRADLLADVRDLVDERDLGREERIGGVLDHLGRGHVRDQLGAAERPVEAGDAVAERLAALTPYDHAVGVLEVGDRAALAQELGIRGVGDAGQPPSVERAPEARSGAGRDGRLHDEHRVGRAGGNRADDGLDTAQIGVTGCARRSVDAHEGDEGALEQLPSPTT